MHLLSGRQQRSTPRKGGDLFAIPQEKRATRRKSYSPPQGNRISLFHCTFFPVGSGISL